MRPPPAAATGFCSMMRKNEWGYACMIKEVLQYTSLVRLRHVRPLRPCVRSLIPCHFTNDPQGHELICFHQSINPQLQSRPGRVLIRADFGNPDTAMPNVISADRKNRFRYLLSPQRIVFHLLSQLLTPYLDFHTGSR